MAYWFSNNIISINGWIGFSIKLITSCMLIAIVEVALFHKCEEFEYVKNTVKVKFLKGKCAS